MGGHGGAQRQGVGSPRAPVRAATLSNIGEVHRDQGRYAEALSYYERSLRLAEKLGDEPSQALTLTSIGVLHAGDGRYAEAMKLLDRALEIADRLGIGARDQIRRTRDQVRNLERLQRAIRE